MEEMIFVTFSDQWGRFEATFFPAAYRRAARVLFRGPGPFLILPNHPAYIEPPTVLTRLWPKFKARPLILETNFKNRF